MFRTVVTAGLAVLALATVAYGRTATAREHMLQGPYLGSYAATLTLAQASAQGDSRMAGKFTLALRANGTYRTSNPLDGPSHGRLAALSGRRLRFYADVGCKFGGFERPQGGVYRWSMNGRRLTLHLVNEGPCTGRTQTLTYPVWVRK
jgi:hypothetical protein